MVAGLMRETDRRIYHSLPVWNRAVKGVQSNDGCAVKNVPKRDPAERTVIGNIERVSDVGAKHHLRPTL